MIHLGQKQASQIRFLVLFTGFATTLMIWPSMADPIGIPKMFVLTILSAWVLGSVLTGVVSARTGRFSLGQWAVAGFALGVLVAALFTDVKYTAFFGTQQRNDGAFTYIAFASLSFAAMVSFTSLNIRQVRTWLLVIGGVLSVHGLLQTFGHDPFKWNNLYNPIIGTLGNPDFFSGIMGAAAIASVWLILVDERRWAKGTGIALLLVELFVLKRCGSIQGIAAFAVGLVILVVIKFWQMQKRTGILASIVVGIMSIPAILGLLNVGPLASHLYRGSFRSRIDYWRAALGMFKAHPLAGIGLDRFGENYSQYAPQIQVVQGQPTDNAHNVFLQLIATGGLLVILPYLLLLSVIFIVAVRAIKNSTGIAQIDVVALFSIWFALLLVSFISIDNLGVAIWLWIAGGALYGVSRCHIAEREKPIGKQKIGNTVKRTSSNDLNILSPIISLALSVLMLLLMVPAWKTSSMLFDIERHSGSWTKTQFVDKINRAAINQPSNVQAIASLADLSLRISAIDLGLKFTKSINERDPRSINGNYLSAFGYEMLKNYVSAIPYRVRLLTIDPWGTKNMLQLVTDYVQLKDLAKARGITSRLSQLYPNNPDTKSAEALVKG